MIGLSLDPNSKTPRDYAKKNNLGWIMGFQGEKTTCRPAMASKASPRSF